MSAVLEPRSHRDWIIGEDSAAKVELSDDDRVIVLYPDGVRRTIYLGPYRLPTWAEFTAMSPFRALTTFSWLIAIGCGDYARALSRRFLHERLGVPITPEREYEVAYGGFLGRVDPGAARRRDDREEALRLQRLESFCSDNQIPLSDVEPWRYA